MRLSRDSEAAAPLFEIFVAWRRIFPAGGLRHSSSTVHTQKLCWYAFPGVCASFVLIEMIYWQTVLQGDNDIYAETGMSRPRPTAPVSIHT